MHIVHAMHIVHTVNIVHTLNNGTWEGTLFIIISPLFISKFSKSGKTQLTLLGEKVIGLKFIRPKALT